jgi:carbonic anhydrase
MSQVSGDRNRWLRPSGRCAAALLLACVALYVAPALAGGRAPEDSAPDGLARLKEGNARFVAGKLRVHDIIGARREAVERHRPYAIILSCADARVPPELVFDENLGRIFVVRVAGNVADPVGLGSMEYAAQVLHAKLLVVLGHGSCGAVESAIAGGEAPPHIAAILDRIAPAVARAKEKGLNRSETLNAAIEENVRVQMQNIRRESSILKGMIDKGDVQMVGGVYNLRTGMVDFLR